MKKLKTNDRNYINHSGTDNINTLYRNKQMQEVKKYLNEQSTTVKGAIENAYLTEIIKILIWEYSNNKNTELTNRAERLEVIIEATIESLRSGGMKDLAQTIEDSLNKIA